MTKQNQADTEIHEDQLRNSHSTSTPSKASETRYTLAVRRVTRGDTASDVLAEFLGLVDDFDFDVKAVYVDREFDDRKCLTLM